jgi:septum formation protein
LFWNPDILPPDTSIILASASPRRQELLTNAGIAFEVRPANIPEVPRAGEAPIAFAERMAREKARAVRASLPNRIILAADTVVAVEDEILGKPADTEDAIGMLCLLSGRTHAVTTGVCLIGNGFEDVRYETTAVEFSRMTEAEIRDYVSTGEPMDKAGAYAIQGGASGWITRIDGDYNNVVGLPVKLVLRMLRERLER